MKKAKLALTAVALSAVIGGALAFKASRQLHDFYAYTTTLQAGKVTGACLFLVQTSYLCNQAGTITISLACSSTIGVTTCTARVVKVN